MVRDGRPRATWKLGPSAPTIFDAAHAAGRSSAAVFGDHRLIGVMGARAADVHWPLDGQLPEGLPTDDHGYAYDEAVLEQLVPLLDGPDGPDLVVGHLNEPDTMAHVHGPDSDAAIATYRSTDAHVQPIVDALQARWADTVLIVVSDHDQETVTVEEPIDLHAAAAAADIDAFVMPELSGAVVWGDDPLRGSWLDGVEGVAGHREAWPGARVVWSEPGALVRHAARDPWERRHREGPARRRHHPQPGRHRRRRPPGGLAQIGAAMAARQVEAADWATTISALLDLDLSGATGHDLSGARS